MGNSGTRVNGRPNSAALRKIQIFWSVFIGAGAYFGGALMLISPEGDTFGMAPMLEDMQALPWPHIFFRNFIFPGIALIVVNGLTNTAAFVLLMKRSRYGGLAGAVCGMVLMLWITVQFVIFRFNFMSAIYFAFGILQAVNGMSLHGREIKNR